MKLYLLQPVAVVDEDRVASELRGAQILDPMVESVDLSGAVESEDGREPHGDRGEDLALLSFVRLHAQVVDVAADLVELSLHCPKVVGGLGRECMLILESLAVVHQVRQVDVDGRVDGGMRPEHDSQVGEDDAVAPVLLAMSCVRSAGLPCRPDGKGEAEEGGGGGDPPNPSRTSGLLTFFWLFFAR